jgi:hypothetical protein
MPFPATVHVTRIIKAPPGAREDVVERVAEALRRTPDHGLWAAVRGWG